MTLPEATTPEALARHLGWGEKRLRTLARRLGACRVLGNRMVFLPDDVAAIMEATRPCPSKSIGVREAMSGAIGERLPDIDSVELLAQLTRKPQRVLRPRSRTESGNVVSMEKRKP